MPNLEKYVGIQHKDRRMKPQAPHLMQGKQAEALAANYLLEKNFQILDKNARIGHLEVDIIAYQAPFLIFVEVKSLRKNPHVQPEQRVNAAKITNLKRFASAYQSKINYKGEIRFDIIAISFHPFAYEIAHFEDAFL